MSEPRVTIALIVKNESNNLDGFFETIQPIADELVVAYSPSSDDTLAKLEAWKKKANYPVIIFEPTMQPFHYGQARNTTIEHATSEYVFLLDTDERIPEYTARNLKNFLREKNRKYNHDYLFLLEKRYRFSTF